MNTRAPVYLVVGGSGAIGGAIVNNLIATGAQVVSWSRTRESSHATLSVQVDCTVADSVRSAMTRTVDVLGQIDGLVHCVGDIYDPVPITALNLERLERSYRLCVGSALLVAQACFPHLCKSQGSAVFISSVASMHPYPGIADYCAAKAGLEALVRSLAVELAEHGGRANSVCPAVVDSPLFDRSPYTVAEANGWHALGRIGKPTEIASLVGWLLSPESSWMTGSAIKYDGGMSVA